jgi:hypothetical protein
MKAVAQTMEVIKKARIELNAIVDAQEQLEREYAAAEKRLQQGQKQLLAALTRLGAPMEVA